MKFEGCYSPRCSFKHPCLIPTVFLPPGCAPPPPQPAQVQAPPASQVHVSDSASSSPPVHVSEEMRPAVYTFSSTDSMSTRLEPATN